MIIYSSSCHWLHFAQIEYKHILYVHETMSIKIIPY